MIRNLLLAFALIFSLNGYCQFGGQFSTPSGTFLEDVVYADSNTVMVTGSNLYRTSIDGGRNWLGLSSAGMFVKAADFSSIHFGIAVGGAGAYRTNTECGYYWGWSNNKSVGVSKDLLDVHFSDDLHGFVCGNDGTLRYTSNQGTTWTGVVTGITNHIKGVYCINDSVAFACANGGIVLKVQNGVVIQNTVLNGSIDLNKIFFPSTTTGYVIGTLGNVYKTTDAGATWNPLSLSTTENLLSLEFTNVNHGVITGTNGKIWVTSNGGANWTPAVSAPTGEVRSVAFKNDNEGYAVGSNFVVYTGDGGYNWVRVDGNTQSVYFSTPDRGFVVGYNGMAYKTEDKGNTWKPMKISTIQYLNDVYFLNADTGYIVGGPEVHRTLDGGETWSLVPNPAQSSLYSVHFTDYMNGVAVGYNRTIIRTTNGGASWTLSQNSTSGIWYLDIVFTSPLIGYYSASNGSVYKTTNGGATWTAQGTGTTSQLGDLFFLNDNVGWAVGSAGTIRHTTNGGANWTAQTSGVTTYLAGVHFLDANRGMIVGTAGTYLITYNGGATWISKPGGGDYTDLFFTDSLHGYATVGGSLSAIGTFSNIGGSYAYCPGDNYGFNSFDPYHIANVQTNVVLEMTAANDSFSNAITLDALTIDSVGSVTAVIPTGLPQGLYKTRIRDVSNPSNVSYEKYIVLGEPPVVSFTVQGNTLVASSSQVVTYQWWYKSPTSSSFAFAGSGAVLPITGSGEYYVRANTDCCDSESDTLTIINCNGQYAVASSYNHSLAICSGDSITIGSNTYYQAGTYTDTLTNIAGCDSIVVTNLSINAPASSQLNQSLCYGDSLLFGGVYQSQAGTYSDTLVSMSGCDSIVVLQLSVQPQSITNNSYSICQGNSVTVGSSVYSIAGSYTDVLTNMSGCDSTVYTNLTVDPLPVVALGSDTMVCDGNTVTLNAGPGMTSYLWSTGETTQMIAVTDSGSYSVSVSDPNGCIGSDNIAVDFDICVSLADHTANDGVNIYPNPSKGYFTIETDLEGAELVIYNSLGQVIIEKLLSPKETLNLVQAGVYYVKITGADYSFSRTVLVID
jgi:photosystem II stability/assembly factor-like uncharacterized protein